VTDLFQEMLSTNTPNWLDHDRAVCTSVDMGWGRIFGGQLLAQATAVAQQHKSTIGFIHSIHAHFIALGSVDQDVEYQIIPVRKGRTYSSVRVEGYQQEQIIFHAFLSFQLPEQGLEYQSAMPKVPPPDELQRYQKTLQQMVSALPQKRKEQISKRWLERLSLEPPVDIRPIKPSNFLFPDTDKSERLLWFRASKTLPEDLDIHQQILIWLSDFPMLGTALQPHRIPPPSNKVKMASLDHTMWLQAPFRADEWILCHIKSPRSGSGRGLSFANFFTKDGVLIANCAQEGMLRLRQNM
jgi:acyl-CoA thioesterase II